MKNNKLKLVMFCLVFTTQIWATNDNTAFQKFENQYNIGYSLNQGTLVNGAQHTSQYSAQATNIEIERLFNNNLWLNVSSYIVNQYSQENLGSLNGGNGNGSTPFGQNPFMFGINVKTGYSFQLIENSLQLIPYVGLGRNANLAVSTVVANGQAPFTQDFFYTGILGARLNYKLNDFTMVYFDQSYNYNWDNSGAIKSIQTDPDKYGKTYAATNYMLTSAIGAKFNVTEDFQVGLSGFWTSFQPQSNISGTMYTPTNIFGEMITLGFTY